MGEMVRKTPPLPTRVPAGVSRRLVWLPDGARSTGIHLVAGKGSGKSRLMGRVIGWQDFARGVPLVIFDPIGSTIDNLLDKLTRLPQRYQEQLWKRVRYVDMAGRGEQVVPFPLYYRLGGESYFEIAQRYIDTVRKIDPQLEKAPILGLNAFVSIGTHVGMVLAASGFQITEAEGMLLTPHIWADRIAALAKENAQIEPVARFFLSHYAGLSPSDRSAQTQSFLSKVALFGLDPSMRAMFGASHPGIDWTEVIRLRQAVLLDFRGEHNLERRRFKMMWAFSYLMDFVKHRGRTRADPISVIVDELTELSDFDTLGVNPFEKELNALINVYARNCMVWLTIAHQEAFQVSPYTLKTLMTMGTQIVGVTTDPDAAHTLVRQFCPIDPLKVKRREPVWMSVTVGTDERGRDIHDPRIIDWRPVEHSPEEQQLLSEEQFKRLRLFEFLVKPARVEGDATGALHPVTTRSLDAGQWVNEDLVAEARALLSSRTGVPVQALLEEIGLRSPGLHVALPGAVAVPVQGDSHLPDGYETPRPASHTPDSPRAEIPQPAATRSDILGGDDHHNSDKDPSIDRHPELDEVIRERE